MADKLIMNTTTSSKSLDEKMNDSKTSTPVIKNDIEKLPKTGETQILNKLAQSLSESYQLVKQRQQRYNELNAKIKQQQLLPKKVVEETVAPTDTEEWQEVSYAKNKLKRKKQLSSSLTSVTDSVNQEKRTRIEGIQLNCRGKLQLPDNSILPPLIITPAPMVQRVATAKSNTPKLPPAQHNNAETAAASKVQAPPRLKRKMQDNALTIQKLNAVTEQLRLEINDLKSNLLSERGAVRVLRAQNESEIRKYQKDLKKMQATLDLYKKNYQAGKKNNTDGPQANVESLPSIANASLANYEIQRLNNEIIALKDANKALEDKRNINCDADRRKAADIRTLKDSYEIRLTQLTKSAKTEISRLLEELKTKDRNIGQLKKNLQTLQNKNQSNNDVKNISRNATKQDNTSKTTTSNLTNKTTNKPKNMKTKQQNNEKINKINNKEENEQNDKDDTTKQEAPNANELNKLKDFELLNNTKNLQNNINQFKTTAKILTNSQSNNKLKLLNNDYQQQQHLHNMKTTTTTAATKLNDENSGVFNYQNHREYHSLPHEITERLLGNTTITTVSTTPTTVTTTLTTTINAKATNKQQQQNDAQEYNNNRTKEQNSDSDSALSSAPTSISPQPPPGGLETADIWQMIRSYTKDMEKLQTNIDELQKENIELHKQLDLAKEQIMETEKTAMKQINNNVNLDELMKRIKLLEDREHELESEANDLREQNELLEFRILELEEGNDKWSLQSHSVGSATSSASSANACQTAANSAKNVWQCNKGNNKDNAMQLIFGAESVAGNTINNDSGITSPQSQRNLDIDLQIYETVVQEQLLQRISTWLQKSNLSEEEQQCLQQVLNLLQQLEMLSTQRSSEPASLNTNSSASDETNSLDMIKPRVSDYSCCNTAASRENCNKKSTATSNCNNYQTRIVATVQPYGYNCNSNNTFLQQVVPSNTPAESPRKSRYNWQTNSLSESGVFVECDFLSDNSLHTSASTQTDVDEATAANKPLLSAQLSNDKRLQYYQERLQLLESKVLIYESSGDLQAKRLADRLQREIQLEKELHEVQDRVEFLESENSQLEEEKCEFEEAENDTRLRLQRLEVELEILSQRNIELEVSREALSAKYKDCNAECLVLKDDLRVSETRILHLQQDKQQIKENLEFLHNLLPIFLCYNICMTAAQLQTAKEVPLSSTNIVADMGNNESCSCTDDALALTAQQEDRMLHYSQEQPQTSHFYSDENEICRPAIMQLDTNREQQYLKDEIKCLRNQIKMMNSRHFEALETADSHWLELERGYKDREEAFRAKEVCLKQKINRLQDCLRDDARAANEKIAQLEDVERELKSCLKRLSKEHRDMSDQLQSTLTELDSIRNKNSEQKTQIKPLCDALENEKKHSKMLGEELGYMRKLQQETEKRSLAEMETLRKQLYDLRKEFLHIEVTNSELKEEVCCLECKIKQMQCKEKQHMDKICELCDEVRSKEEIVQKLEKRLERSDGFSLAQELNGGSPSKRFKREDVKDLRSAATGLNSTLQKMQDCDLPSQQDFKNVAFEVKKLADKLLYGNEGEQRTPLKQLSPVCEVTDTSASKLIVTEITRI